MQSVNTVDNYVDHLVSTMYLRYHAPSRRYGYQIQRTGWIKWSW
jgi:hypothetical protein